MFIHTARSVTLGQIRHNSGRKFLNLNWSIRPSFLVVQEHVYILDTVGQGPTTPLHLIEKELALKTAGDLDGCPPVIR